MKTMLLTSAAVALSLTVSKADQFKHYDDHFALASSHHYGHAVEGGPKGSFLRRLSIAPRSYGCGGHGSNLGALQNAAFSAQSVKMLGKVEYGYGKSWLGHEAKHGIESLILRSGLGHCPDALIVVLGFADKTGCASANLRLSDSRAESVKDHIVHVGWEHGLRFRSATVAMGEEAELCNHSLGHNRVAEIWLIEFPRVVSIVKPVVEHTTVETRIVQPRARAVINTVPSQTVAVSAQRQALSAPQAPQVLTQPGNFGPAPQSQIFQAPAPQMLPQPQPQNFGPPAQGQMMQAPRPQIIPQPQPQNFGPLAQSQMMQAPATQMLPQPQPQNFGAPAQSQMIPAPAPQMIPQSPAIETPIQSAPQNAIEAAIPTQTQPQPLAELVQQNPTAAAPAPDQLMSMPSAGNPLQGLADFLQKNVILSNDADRNEFAQKLEALKSLGVAAANPSPN